MELPVCFLPRKAAHNIRVANMQIWGGETVWKSEALDTLDDGDVRL